MPPQRLSPLRWCGVRCMGRLAERSAKSHSLQGSTLVACSLGFGGWGLGFRACISESARWGDLPLHGMVGGDRPPSRSRLERALPPHTSQSIAFQGLRFVYPPAPLSKGAAETIFILGGCKFARRRPTRRGRRGARRKRSQKRRRNDPSGCACAAPRTCRLEWPDGKAQGRLGALEGAWERIGGLGSALGRLGRLGAPARAMGRLSAPGGH